MAVVSFLIDDGHDVLFFLFLFFDSVSWISSIYSTIVGRVYIYYPWV